MGIKPLEITHSGELVFGDIIIPVAVLEDSTRLISQADFQSALGRTRTPSRPGDAIARLPVFLSAKNLEPFIDEAVERSLTPVWFKPKKGGGASSKGSKGGIGATGYSATLLPEVCKVYMRADKAGKLTPSQKDTAKRAEILLHGFATVGIIALVDEATGYQYDRARNALQEILEAFIAKELMPWQKRFPDEFYQEMFRLRRWTPNAVASRRPAIAGKLTNNVVYERLAPGVLDELKSKAPRDKKGRLKAHYHRHLTNDIGHPALRAHLEVVIALMKISPDWNTFIKHLDKTKPVQKTAPLFEEIKPKQGKSEDEITLAMPRVKPKDALKAFMEVDPKQLKD